MSKTRGKLLDRYLAARNILAWKQAITRQYTETVARTVAVREKVRHG